MKRNPRKLKWTKAFRKAAGKEMTLDSTFEFEKRRHIPIKYNRELMADTIKAIKRVSEIRQRRERAFYKNRMLAARQAEKVRDKALVTKNVDVLPRLTRAKEASEARSRVRVRVKNQTAVPMTLDE